MSRTHAKKLAVVGCGLLLCGIIQVETSAGPVRQTPTPRWTPKEVNQVATRLQYGTGRRDRHGVRVIPDTSPRWLSPDGIIRCPKCNGLDPDCDLCVSETPEARIYHHLRTSEQVDLVALYRALDEARQEVSI